MWDLIIKSKGHNGSNRFKNEKPNGQYHGLIVMSH
jgi:hypothetical protein